MALERPRWNPGEAFNCRIAPGEAWELSDPEVDDGDNPWRVVILAVELNHVLVEYVDCPGAWGGCLRRWHPIGLFMRARARPPA